MAASAPGYPSAPASTMPNPSSGASSSGESSSSSSSSGGFPSASSIASAATGGSSSSAAAPSGALTPAQQFEMLKLQREVLQLQLQLGAQNQAAARGAQDAKLPLYQMQLKDFQDQDAKLDAQIAPLQAQIASLIASRPGIHKPSRHGPFYLAGTSHEATHAQVADFDRIEKAIPAIQATLAPLLAQKAAVQAKREVVQKQMQDDSKT